MEHREKVTNAVKKSRETLMRAQFDESQSEALIEVTVRLLNATWAPVLSQLQSLEDKVDDLKADRQSIIQTVEDKVDALKADQQSIIQTVEDKVDALKAGQQSMAKTVDGLR